MKTGGAKLRGAARALPAVLFYIGLPVLLRIGTDSAYGGYDASGLETALAKWAVLGIPLVALEFFKGYYPKGSKFRFYTWIADAAVSILWILVVTGFGSLPGILVGGSDGTEMVMSIGSSALAVLFSLYKLMNIPIAFSDRRENVKAYHDENNLDEHGEPMGDRRIRIKGRYD